ncbi:hypothetical protein EON62_04420, partial [archaeon]
MPYVCAAAAYKVDIAQNSMLYFSWKPVRQDPRLVADPAHDARRQAEVDAMAGANSWHAGMVAIASSLDSTTQYVFRITPLNSDGVAIPGVMQSNPVLTLSPEQEELRVQRREKALMEELVSERKKRHEADENMRARSTREQGDNTRVEVLMRTISTKEGEASILKEDKKKLEQRVAALESEKAAVEAQVAASTEASHAEACALRERVAALESEKATMIEETCSLRAELRCLLEEENVASSRKLALSNEMSALRARVISLESDKAAAEAALAAATVAVNTQRSAASSYSVRMLELEAECETLRQQVAEVQQTLPRAVLEALEAADVDSS